MQNVYVLLGPTCLTDEIPTVKVDTFIDYGVITK